MADYRMFTVTHYTERKVQFKSVRSFKIQLCATSLGGNAEIDSDLLPHTFTTFYDFINPAVDDERTDPDGSIDFLFPKNPVSGKQILYIQNS